MAVPKLQWQVSVFTSRRKLNLLIATLKQVNKIRGLAQTLLGAGSNTLKESLEFILLLLALNQDVQERIYQEIKTVIGSERRPTYADRAEMPFTQASLSDAMRVTTLLPINLPHL